MNTITKDETFQFLGHSLRVVIDRPLGWQDSRFKRAYPLNYGFVPGFLSPDGEEVDAYVLGEDQPLQEFEGLCIAIVERLDDEENKLVIAKPGYFWSEAEIRRQIDFIEQYFCSRIVMA
jgi:inorganic pyrophosphatase